MKTLVGGAAMAMGLWAGVANAEQTLIVDGKEQPLAVLMTVCQAIEDQAEQIACFNDLSRMIGEQEGGVQADSVSVPDALEALRDVAQYQDEETGLLIYGSGCVIQVLYYGNYFHVSRRNISEIDVVGVSFDAAKVQPDRVVNVAGSQPLLSRGAMEDGAAARVHGGIGLDSSQHGFAPKSARMSIGEFATEVAAQVPAQDVQDFEFVLVHPQRSGSGADIWAAFDTFVGACVTESALPGSS